IDFTGGVKFTVGLAEVVTQVWFKGEPRMVIREKNAGNGESYPLKDGTLLEISNHAETNCGTVDYLLHYFATTINMLTEKPPEWPVQGPTRPPAGEVYCSNSTYP